MGGDESGGVGDEGSVGNEYCRLEHMGPLVDWVSLELQATCCNPCQFYTDLRERERERFSGKSLWPSANSENWIQQLHLTCALGA